MRYQDINSRVISGWCRNGWEWGRPITHEVYEKALAGDWDVYLTPTRAVPHEWFGELAGRKLLGLASGGGQQLPIFTALGARCTLLDYPYLRSPPVLPSARRRAPLCLPAAC